ncbi:MAG: hypothetical protein JJU45_17105 [Acidimicrobiia bacterium]|nr:hypothetical protein [Acidimicrobiia bacterium]
MPSITIRDVPDDTRDELAARAARAGQSLQEYLRLHLIETTQRPDARALADRIATRKDRTGTALSPDVIVGHRDAERR